GVPDRDGPVRTRPDRRGRRGGPARLLASGPNIPRVQPGGDDRGGPSRLRNPAGGFQSLQNERAPLVWLTSRDKTPYFSQMILKFLGAKAGRPAGRDLGNVVPDLPKGPDARTTDRSV